MFSRKKKPALTLREFLEINGISIKKCAKDNGLKVPTLYAVWNGQKRLNRKNEKNLIKYTRGLVTWEGVD